AQRARLPVQAPTGAPPVSWCDASSSIRSDTTRAPVEVCPIRLQPPRGFRDTATRCLDLARDDAPLECIEPLRERARRVVLPGRAGRTEQCVHDRCIDGAPGVQDRESLA